MDIEFLTNGAEREWDAFLARCPGATFYHQTGWKHVLEKTYGMQPVYVMAMEQGEIRGVLPLFLIEGTIFGSKLISLPFAPYGGIAAPGDCIQNMIFGEILSYARERNIGGIELRNVELLNVESSVDRSYSTLLLSLTRDTGRLWGGLRKSMRRYVKKSSENNLELSLDSQDVREFYTLYSNHMHHLGSPAHGYDFFKNLSLEFPQSTQIAMVTHENNPVSSIFLLKFNNRMIYGWGASDTLALDLYPNYFLFWEVLQYCAGLGMEIFDFGRSLPDEGTYTFKTGWGAEPAQLYYQRYPPGKNYSGVRKTSFRRRMFTGIWKRIPGCCANTLGPAIRRRVP